MRRALEKRPEPHLRFLHARCDLKHLHDLFYLATPEGSALASDIGDLSELLFKLDQVADVVTRDWPMTDDYRICSEGVMDHFPDCWWSRYNYEEELDIAV